MKEYDFFVRGSPPRKASFYRQIWQMFAAVLGKFPWMVNVARLHAAQIAGLLFPGVALFLIGALLPSLYLAIDAATFSPAEFLKVVRENAAAAPLIVFLVNSIYDEELIRTLLILASLYATARILQHFIDFRAWHTPWAPAHAARVFSRIGFPGARDYPCMIIGVGGSGKSTLAQILEHSYVNRRLIKLRNQDDIGEERITIARRVGEAGVGATQKAYKITWAPGRFQVGRMAEAYDLPGQIVEDWSIAFDQMTGADGPRPRRMAIFHVVSNGFNASIRKFKLTEECESAQFLSMVREGKIPIDEGRVQTGYDKEYRVHYRQLEIDAFRTFVEACVKLKDRRGAPTNRIEILLVHVVGMASHWAGFERVDGNLQLKPNCCEALDFYRDEFSKVQQDLGRIPGVVLTVGYLPASLQFGEMKHEAKPELSIFGLADAPEGLYEDNSKREVMARSALSLATVKTVRALRLALHSRPSRWLHEDIATRKPETDLFDRWTAGIVTGDSYADQ